MKAKLIVILLTTPVAIPVSNVVDFYSVCEILSWLFIVDLATGISASYFEWKKGDKKDRWFFGRGEGFSSDKAKKCGFKAMLYMTLPLIAVKFQSTFMLRNWKPTFVTDAEIDTATGLLLVFCGIELFSIFNENLPKCGINVWRIVKRMLGMATEVKSKITEYGNE